MKFGYAIMYVVNLEESVSFYERAFGFERSFVHESGYAELKTETTKLAFATIDLAESHGFEFEASSLERKSFGMEIGLVTEDVSKYYASAIAAGATPLSAPKQKPWGQTVSYVRDLNGFIVEICSPV